MLGNRIKAWLPTLLWMGLIFLLSSIPDATISQTSWLDFILRKSIHLFEYAALAILLSRNLKMEYAISLSIFYALTDEFHQTFVPGRTGIWTDVLVDGVGAVLGLWLWSRLEGKIPWLSRWRGRG